MRYTTAINMISILLIITTSISCRTSSPDEDDNYQLSYFIDKEHQIYLTHGVFPGSYEFVICDAQVDEPASDHFCDSTQNTSCNPVDDRPKHCVSAYRNAPIAKFCDPYPSHKHLCEMKQEILEYCNSSNIATAIPPDPDITPNLCPALKELANNCSSILPGLSTVCEKHLSNITLCQASGDRTSAECGTAFAYAQERMPYYMYDLNLSIQQKNDIFAHIRYEDYVTNKNLSTSNNAKKWKFFGSGTAMGLFNSHTFEAFKQIMPDIPIMQKQITKQRTVSLVKKKVTVIPKLDVKEVIAGAALTGTNILAAEINGDPVKYIQQSIAYSPTINCTLELMSNQKTPMPQKYPRENFQETGKALREAATPFFAGVGSQLVIAKATAKSNRWVRIGSMLVLPFVAMVKGHTYHPEAQDIQDLQNHLTHILSNRTESTSPVRMTSIAKTILPMLGRSIAIANPLPSIEQYCLPKMQEDGSYAEHCQPITEDDGGMIANAIYRKNIPTNTTPACQTLFEQRFQELYPMTEQTIIDRQ